LSEFVPDDHVTLRPFRDATGGPPANGGLLFKVVPDETMRGLELRNGSVDLVVNDLSPDWCTVSSRTRRSRSPPVPARTTRTSASTARSAAARCARAQAIALAVDTQAIIAHLRRGLARPASGIVPSMSWAYNEMLRLTRTTSNRRAACSTRPACAIPTARDRGTRFVLTLKTSTAEAYRLQAAVIQRDLPRPALDWTCGPTSSPRS
jgi:peptide/nickel transport system substrate-binding protein